MEEDRASLGQREGHGTDSAAYGLDVWSTHCPATVEADVRCVRNGWGGDILAEVGHGGFVESGAISGGVGASCWSAVGSNGVV